MSKMGSHDPFGYLNHKLWPKKGPWVKLPIWFSIIKIRKSPWFTYVQVTCHISLESSRIGLQLFFRPCFNRRYAQEVMGFQTCRSPNFGNFKTPNLGILGQNDIWVHAPWQGIENIGRGKLLASPKWELWWVLWVLWIHLFLWLVNAPKVFQLCTNQLVVWFV